MATEQINKSGAGVHQHNLTNYTECYAQFDWQQAKDAIATLPGGINIGYEAVDRHVDEGHGEQTALRWLGKSSQVLDISYLKLKQQTARFSSVLGRLGVEVGDTVFGLCGRVPQLYYAVLGSLKFGAVFSPLFSAFGPEPVKARMTIGDARVLVTSHALYKKKVLPWREEMPGLKHVLLYGIKGELPDNCIDLDSAMAEADPDFPVRACDDEQLALLHFTSGTTGKPKGVMHVHAAVAYHKLSGCFALDLRPEMVFWCTADPGWVTGTSYGIISPLCHRTTLIIDEQEFDAEHWYQVLAEHKVNIWYTAPTAIRMLMKAGAELVEQYDLSALQFMASVGEPLNPEAVRWSQQTFGMPFHDNWWQSETGGIMIANFASEPVRPGSMGQPMPGVTAAVVERHEDGHVTPIGENNKVGELALKPGWPSMFRGYLNEQARYDKCFVDGWYLSGDLAMRDEDGYFWFVGRADDVIKSSGHLIGPFEVESTLMEHPSVAEVGVIGVPDETAGQLVKAYVALKPGNAPDEALTKSLMAHARKRLGAAVAPREILFRENLPKTRSGKIMRRLLKARELGLPEGDISTLESDES
ncbi:acetate--CoA ligase [Corallincola platygyrae]